MSATHNRQVQEFSKYLLAALPDCRAWPLDFSPSRGKPPGEAVDGLVFLGSLSSSLQREEIVQEETISQHSFLLEH